MTAQALHPTRETFMPFLCYWATLLGIDVTFAKGQAYDGASAMSLEACGVQGRIRRIAPMALYTHCNSDVLNLSVAAACRLTSFRNMIGTLNETFLFFHFSPARQRFLEQVLEKCGSTSRKEKLTVDEIACFCISETWRKHAALWFRYIYVLRKCENSNLRDSVTSPERKRQVTFPSYLSPQISAVVRFRHVSANGFASW